MNYAAPKIYFWRSARNSETGTSCLQSLEESAFFEASIFSGNKVRRYLNQNNIKCFKTNLFDFDVSNLL